MKQKYILPKLKSWEWGYIAGMLDGEGWIGFQQDRKHKRPTIVISGTNKEAMEWINKKLNNTEKFIRVEMTKWKGKQAKPIYRVRMRNKEVFEKVLKKLLPYLIVKKDKATICLKQL